MRWAAVSTADDTKLLKRTKNSFKYFHPEIPFVGFSGGGEEGVFGNLKPIDNRYHSRTALLQYRLVPWLLEQYDGVIALHSDVVVTDVMEEILVGDFDVAVSLCSTLARADFCRYNVGVWATTSMGYAKTLCEMVYNLTHILDHSACHIMNHSPYKVKELDSENGDVYYNEDSSPFWRELRVDNNKLLIRNKTVRSLHWGGTARHHKRGLKYSCSWFSQEVKEHLNKITNTTDFTDYDGVWMGKLLAYFYEKSGVHPDDE